MSANVLAILEAAQGMSTNEEYIDRIKEQARTYVNDNVRSPTDADYIYTENAFLLGALIYAGYAGSAELAEPIASTRRQTV